MRIIFILLIVVFGTSCLADEKGGLVASEELVQLKEMLSEKEVAFNRLQTEKEALLSKVDALQRLILDRDADVPRLMEQAQASCRLEMEQMKNELSVAQLTAMAKNERLGVLEKEKDTWQYQLDMLVGEKVALRQSLKDVAGEADILKRDVAALKRDALKKLAEAQDAARVVESQLKSRLLDEQSRVQQKIALAQKPWEDKIITMEEALKSKEVLAREQLAAAKAAGEERVRQREEQIAILRESAGREIKKAQDAALMDVQRIQEQLTACRSEKK